MRREHPCLNAPRMPVGGRRIPEVLAALQRLRADRHASQVEDWIGRLTPQQHERDPCLAGTSGLRRQGAAVVDQRCQQTATSSLPLLRPRTPAWSSVSDPHLLSLNGSLPAGQEPAVPQGVAVSPNAWPVVLPA